MDKKSPGPKEPKIAEIDVIRREFHVTNVATEVEAVAAIARFIPTGQPHEQHPLLAARFPSVVAHAIGVCWIISVEYRMPGCGPPKPVPRQGKKDFRWPMTDEQQEDCVLASDTVMTDAISDKKIPGRNPPEPVERRPEPTAAPPLPLLRPWPGWFALATDVVEQILSKLHRIPCLSEDCDGPDGDEPVTSKNPAATRCHRCAAVRLGRSVLAPERDGHGH